MNIRETIEKILLELVPHIDLSSNHLMNEEGVQSLTMIHLISELDIAFDIEITFDDIDNDHFCSVEAIENMVKGYLK